MRFRTRPALLAVATATLTALGCHAPPLANDEPDPPGIAELQGHGEPDVDPLATPTCAADAWTTYAHDAARTSASGGCVSGPLRLAWTMHPRCASGCTSFATRAIADGDSVYVAGSYGPTPTLWRLDARTGAPAWTYNSRTESVRGGWPTLAQDKVFLVDDGVNEADATTGVGHRAELDAWGESLSDGTHLFAENDWYLDGYGLYLSAFDLNLKLLWRRDYNALARGVTVPDVGGLAYADGLLVHAAQHGPLTGSGLSAFDPTTSERRWRADVSPMSSPSIAGGSVFAIERWPGERTDRLAARSLADGKLLWAHPVTGARGPAPVVAGGLVVVHGTSGVQAVDRTTGADVWSAPLPRRTEPVQSATTLAAAMGSRILVVVSGTTLYLLHLDDGTESWEGIPVPHARRLEAPAIAGEALYVVADGAVVRLDSAHER